MSTGNPGRRQMTPAEAGINRADSVAKDRFPWATDDQRAAASIMFRETTYNDGSKEYQAEFTHIYPGMPKSPMKGAVAANANDAFTDLERSINSAKAEVEAKINTTVTSGSN